MTGCFKFQFDSLMIDGVGLLLQLVFYCFVQCYKVRKNRQIGSIYVTHSPSDGPQRASHR